MKLQLATIRPLRLSVSVQRRIFNGPSGLRVGSLCRAAQKGSGAESEQPQASSVAEPQAEPPVGRGEESESLRKGGPSGASQEGQAQQTPSLAAAIGADQPSSNPSLQREVNEEMGSAPKVIAEALPESVQEALEKNREGPMHIGSPETKDSVTETVQSLRDKTASAGDQANESFNQTLQGAIKGLQEVAESATRMVRETRSLSSHPRPEEEPAESEARPENQGRGGEGGPSGTNLREGGPAGETELPGETGFKDPRSETDR